MNNYKRAVEIILNYRHDPMALVLQVAAVAPEAIVKAIDGRIIDALTEECLSLVRQGKKLNAIKRWREVTNVSLKEAEDVIEALTPGASGILPLNNRINK